MFEAALSAIDFFYPAQFLPDVVHRIEGILPRRLPLLRKTGLAPFFVPERLDQETLTKGVGSVQLTSLY
jgi:hypothetical protein